MKNKKNPEKKLYFPPKLGTYLLLISLLFLLSCTSMQSANDELPLETTTATQAILDTINTICSGKPYIGHLPTPNEAIAGGGANLEGALDSANYHVVSCETATSESGTVILIDNLPHKRLIASANGSSYVFVFELSQDKQTIEVFLHEERFILKHPEDPENNEMTNGIASRIQLGSLPLQPNKTVTVDYSSSPLASSVQFQSSITIK